MAEWNARVAYLMAQHGISDFTTALGDIGERLWPEPKNLTALSHPRFEKILEAARTRMNSGDSHAESPSGGGGRAQSLAPAP